MKTETASGLILSGTLFIGVTLGALGTGAWAQWRERRVEAIGDEGGFVGHMESIIEPRDEAQREAIRPYLEAADARNREIIDKAQSDLRTALQEMRELIEPSLDEEQIRRLDRRTRRSPPMGPGGRPPPRGEAGRPPPPDGRPVPRPGARRPPPGGAPPN